MYGGNFAASIDPLSTEIFYADFSYLSILGSLPKKNYLVREIVPIPSDTPTIETVSEHLDSEYW